jgi:putative Mn2+ efflux pump MntP
MNWLILLSLAVIIAAVAVVTGIKPKETRPVAHSRMMGMARFVLVVLAIILAYAAFRARAG